MKPLIEWNEELCIGLEEIDEQHKVLVNLINRFHQVAMQPRHYDVKVAAELLEELREYTLVHFTVEESLMRIYNYPGYEAHKAAHGELNRQLSALQTKLHSQGTKVSLEVWRFLRDWLTHHILGDDRDYAPYLLKCGVRAKWAKSSWAGRIWRYPLAT